MPDVHFLIVAPPYSHRSGGIMVLHELCTTLNSLGYRAGLLFITEGSQKDQGFKFAYSNDQALQDPLGSCFDFFTGKTPEEINGFIRNACVVYPDIVKGNPVGGRIGVAYVLGKPEFEVKADIIVSFSKLYIQNPDFVLFKPFVSEWIHDQGTFHWSSRKLDLTYIGKGAEYLECSVVPGSVLVERNWPQDKRQLGALLRNCRYFFTWDNVTATSLDAMLCGAVPVAMHDLQIAPAIGRQSELGSFLPLAYVAGMENSPISGAVKEIDGALAFVQSEARARLAQWPSRVSDFVEIVRNFRR